MWVWKGSGGENKKVFKSRGGGKWVDFWVSDEKWGEQSTWFADEQHVERQRKTDIAGRHFSSFSWHILVLGEQQWWWAKIDTDYRVPSKTLSSPKDDWFLKFYIILKNISILSFVIQLNVLISNSNNKIKIYHISVEIACNNLGLYKRLWTRQHIWKRMSSLYGV